MSTNRDQTSANGKSKAFLTTFVWAPRSENAFSAVILVPKDGFETFFGAHNGVYGAIFPAMWFVWGHLRLFWAMLGHFLGPKRPKTTQNDPKRPKTTQNDPKWPKMTQNDPKWPQNDPKMTPKWPKIDFFKNVSTSFLAIFGVVWGHFRLFWASFGHFWIQKRLQMAISGL